MSLSTALTLLDCYANELFTFRFKLKKFLLCCILELDLQNTKHLSFQIVGMSKKENKIFTHKVQKFCVYKRVRWMT